MAVVVVGSAVSAQAVHLAKDIKLSHTVFALPFALLATFLAAGGWPRTGQLGLIVLCMVTARTVAMVANRLLDARLDGLNPRTRGRAIPSGRVSGGFAAAAMAASGAAFLAACGGFYLAYGNPWPALLGPVVLAFLVAYPLMKRVTSLCHYYLGLALAAAPVCAWLAVSGEVGAGAWVLAGAVLMWTAGFDILYASQDYASDVQTGVFSVPARLGLRRAFWVSRASHVVAGGLLLALPLAAPQLGWLYVAGATAACVLLVVEHCIVSPDDLTRLNMAFFTLNGCVSLVVGTLGIVDVLAG
ncbi:MAG: UbiA-like polyprenyltransferase [Tepidisphaerales bacterium]